MQRETSWPPKPSIPDPIAVTKLHPKWMWGITSVVLSFVPMMWEMITWANQFFWHGIQPRPLNFIVHPLTKLGNTVIPIVDIQFSTLLPGLWFLGLVCGILAKQSLLGRIGILFAGLSILVLFLPYKN